MNSPTTPAVRPARNRIRFAAIAVAAFSVVGVLAPAADAQLRVDNSRITDANPRVGDGGFNGRLTNPFDNRLANDLVVGNVTGGRLFQGFVAFSDERGFRASTTALVSDFTRDSTGVTTGGIVTNNSNDVRRFFGEVEAVNAPPEFVRQPGVAGFVPQTIGAVRERGDRRLGVIDTLDRRLTIDELPEVMGVDPAVLRQFAEEDALDSRFGEDGLEGGLTPDGSAPLGTAQENELLSDFTFLRDRSFGGLDEATIQGIADELNPRGAGEGEDAEGDAQDTPFGQGDNGPLDSNAPLESNQPLDGGAFESNQPLGSNRALGNNVSPFASDSQFAQMSARLEAFNAERRATNAAPADGTDEAEDETPAAPVMPGGNLEPVNPENAPVVPDNLLNRPVRVRDLGAGVQGTPIAPLFATAETAMKDGRFADAAENYRAIERVDPQNALATFGRATAEMAGGYYGRSANTYRAVFLREPALLMAQYDMPALVGEQRLDAVMDDLRSIINEDERAAAPALLMAIIHHNQGESRLAAGFLDLTQRRGGDEVLVDTLRQAWNLPTMDFEK
ncbi:MAG: hypothetical protein AAGD32_17025 [Planctomycetota bacterium]